MALSAPPILASLALVMLTAAATTLLFHRFRQPAILGYLAAGFLVGPHTPLGVSLAESEPVLQLRDLGLVFLMFAVGLEFNLRKVRRVGGVALVAGILEVALMLALGFLVGRGLGYDPLQSILLGSVLAISSTTIIVAILMEQGRMDSEAAHLIFGILIVEDLAAVLLVAVLGGVVGAGAFSLPALALLVGSLAVFVLAALVLGLVVVPRLIDHVSRLPAEEVLIVTVLGLAFGMAILAASLGFSVALGAFIAGAIISEARAVAHVERRIAPIREMFTAVFFVAVGMLIEPAIILAAWPTILALLAVSIVGKIGAVSFAAFVAGYDPRVALTTGIGLAMIGEFSFILAAIAGDVFPDLFAIAVAVSAGTTLVTPVLMRRSPAVIGALGRVLPRPLRTYGSMYRAWAARLQAHGRFRLPGLPKGSGLRLAAYASVVVACVAAAGVLDDFAPSLFPEFPAGLIVLGVWVGFLLLASPALVAGIRSLRATISALADLAIPARLRDREEAEAVTHVLRNTFWLLAAVAVAVGLLVVASPFLPSLPVLAVAVTLVAIASTALYGATAKLNRRMEAAVSAVVEDTPEATSRDDILQVIREQYPWDVHVDHVTVPADSAGAGRSLADLEVRRATGASVIALERSGGRVVNPGPEARLLPGDVVTLLGEREQVAAARALVRHALGAPASSPIAVELLPVLPESRLSGRPVASAGLREAGGATIVGVRRAGGETITNPPPDTVIHGGDLLLVLGTREQVERARAFLAGS